MRTFWQFIRAVFIDWASGITGGASAPFALTSLFVEHILLKTLFGVFAVGLFMFAAYWVWRQPVKELERIRSVTPVLVLSDDLEFDPRSSLYRLLITNSAHNFGSVMATIEEVIIGDKGEPFPDSRLLPFKLEWMHNPGSERVQLGKEKLDVAYIQVGYDEDTASVFLNPAGVSFRELLIPISEGESVYCRLAFYSDANQPMIETWRQFTRPKTWSPFDPALTARLLEDHPDMAVTHLDR